MTTFLFINKQERAMEAKDFKEPLRGFNPHYSNGYGERMIWGQGGDKAVYSDRLMSQDPDKFFQATEDLKAKCKPKSPHYCEELLKIMFDNEKLRLTGILTGVIKTSGMPYQVFFFVEE